MTEPLPTNPPRAASELSAGRTFPGSIHLLARINLGLVAALALGLTVYLLPQWLNNPDLSHGLFMPLVFVFLVWQSRRTGPLRYPRMGAWSLGALAFLGTATLVCLAGAGLFAVSLGWSHSVVAFMLTTAFVAICLAALVALSSEPVRLIPLNWIAFTAAALWLLVVPMPPGTYSTLTLHLQSWVTTHVLTTLEVLGVPARQQGNLIQLANATVGVEEACSGIRSLLACLFTGSFFAAFLVHRPGPRAALLLLAAPLAIAMNFVRSLILTLLANAGVDIGGSWHDVTGFAILAVTAGMLAGLAFLLEPTRRAPEPAPAKPPAGRVSASVAFAGQAVMATLLLLAGALAGFFVLRTRPAVHHGRPTPDLASMLPATPTGWTVQTSTDLYRFADTLDTNQLFQRTYFRGAGDDVTQVTVYLAYWPAGRTSVSNVAMHTPDACWPGVGWQPLPAAGSHLALMIAERKLPASEYRLFTRDETRQYVWFWHFYDGAAITQRDPRSPRELLAIAWRYGFHQSGEQLFVRVSSNRSWDTIAGEPLLSGIFANLRPFGF